MLFLSLLFAGAALTHHNILNNGLFTGYQQKFTCSDKVCIPVPLCACPTHPLLCGGGVPLVSCLVARADHCFGMVMGQLACMTHGAAAVYPSEAFDPDAAVRAAAATKATAMYGTQSLRTVRATHVPVLSICVLRAMHRRAYDVHRHAGGMYAP